MKKSVFAFSAFLLASVTASTSFAQNCDSNQLGGKAFLDTNANSTEDSFESGVAGVGVTVRNPTGDIVASGQTSADGTYILSVPDGQDVRVDFSIPEGLFAGRVGGVANSTRVFLKNQSSCNVNIALSDPKEHCDGDPKVATACYGNGDPLIGGNSGTKKAVVQFRYFENGNFKENPAVPAPDELALASEIGSTWGQAYASQKKLLIAAPNFKRHAGLGPLGLNGLYGIDLSADQPAVTHLITDLQALGINLGDDPRETFNEPLPAGLVTPNVDFHAFSRVGQRGVGGLDLSADEKTLYLVNLFERKVHAISIESGFASLSPSDVQHYPITDPGCSNGDFIPWAIKEHRGSVYVGVACTAETSQNISELHAYVRKLDKSTGTFSTAFDFDLNYPRNGSVILEAMNPRPSHLATWQVRKTDWFDIIPGFTTGFTFVVYPMAVLSDLEFEGENLLISLKDLSGDMFGPWNCAPVQGLECVQGRAIEIVVNAPSGGDLLLARRNGTNGFVLENNEFSNPGKDNGQGPGGGEFFYGENFLVTKQNGNPLQVPVAVHEETTLGGSAAFKGTVLSNQYDVGDDIALHVESGGSALHSVVDGSPIQQYMIYDKFTLGTFGKAAGLGDFTLLCDPAPIQVGNRVWLDTNANGAQDAGESGIAGVTVNLYDSTMTTLISSKVSGPNGEYLFDLTDGLSYETSFKVCVDKADDYSSGPLAGLVATSSNAGSDDGVDSDGVTVDGVSCASFTTGAPGVNDHTFDFGFNPTQCSPVDISDINTIVDGNALQLSRLAKSAARLGTKSRKSCGLDGKLDKSIINSANTIYTETWSLAWSFGTTSFVCEGGIVPASCSTTVLTNSVNTLGENTGELYALVKSALKKVGKGCDPKIAKSKKRISNKAKKLYDESLKALSELPSTLVTNCG